MDTVHSVTKEHQEDADVGDADTALPPMRPEPTAAERARTIAALASEATLCTVAIDPPGTPFGSLVGLAQDAEGRPVLSLSDLAEHSRNLLADPRASVMAVEPALDGDGLARGRVTLLGTCVRLTDAADIANARATYLATHPHAFYVDFADFGFYRLDVAQVRWVGGFGAMDWVDAESYASAEPDPLAGELAASAVEHMNTDHADALLAMVHHQGIDDATGASVVRIDRYGFDAVAATSEGPRGLRIAFGESIETAETLRAAMVRLTKEARAASRP